MDLQDKNSRLFVQLVFMYHAACMEQLGKVKSSMTGKIERNLDAAQSTIDILDMLKEKTRGNLSPDEDRFVTETLRELRLNFVDEKLKDDRAGKEGTEPKQQETAPPEQPESAGTQ